MSLGQPLWLLLGLLAGLLIYFHRQRRAQRAVEVGSLHLWRRLALQSAPRAQPRPRLSAPLLLQGLVLLLVALALARPALGPQAPGGDVLLLLEAGRAMRATDVRPDRFGAARSTALGEVRGRTSILLVSDWPVPLAVGRADSGGVRAALRAAAAGDGTPDWAAAASLARAWTAEHPARVIAYASPGQAPAARAALQTLRATVHVFGESVPNAAISRFTVTPGSGAAPWEVAGAVHQFGPIGKRTLSVALDGRVLSTMVLRVAADGDTSFRLRFTPGGGGVLSARLDASDALPADDGASVVVRPIPMPLRVALVGPAPASGASDPAALGAAALPGARVTRSPEFPVAGGADLLMVTDPARRPSGVLPPVPVTVWLNAPARGAKTDSVLAWDTAEALGQGVSWGDLSALSRADVTPWPTGTALVTGMGGALIEVRRAGGRTEVRVNFPLAAGGWTRTPAFPVFLANLARLARPDTGERVVPPCRVGLPCALPAGTRTLQLPGDSSRPKAGRESDARESFVPWRAGVYHVDGQPLAVNRLAGPEANLRGPGAAASTAAQPFVEGWGAALAAGWRPLLTLALLALGTEFALLLRTEPSLRGRRWAALGRPQRRMLALHAVAGLLLLLGVLDVRLPAPKSAAVTAHIVPPGGAPGPSAQVTIWGGAWPSPAHQPAGVPGDLAAALEVADAALPDGTPHILRVQAGAWPGSARLPDVLAALRAQGTAVVVTSPVAPVPALEVTVFETPAEVMPGQAFAAQVVVASRRAGVARLILRRGDTEMLEVRVTLRAGLNRLTLPLREDVPGTAGYILTVTATGGSAVGGDAVRAFAATRVVPGAVLVVGPDAPARRRLARALKVQRLTSRELRPEQLTAATLAGARRVTLLDTPAQALAPEVRSALVEMVRSGGHLLIAGGHQAFGPGGYVGTALETLSPLSGRVQRDLPRLALGLALDKSGSMNEPVGGGATRLDLIKAAALNAALLLSPESDVAVIAFDSAPKLAVPLTRASQRVQIRAQIGRIEAEGGTVVNRALVTTLGELMKSSASRKHMILLTDGIDGGIFTSEEYRRLIRRIHATGITLSTVSVGGGMHIPLMRDMARWGEGRFVQTQDWRDVPSLLVRDTQELGQSAVKTGTHVAYWASTPGFNGRPFTLARYIRTTLKMGATPLGQVGSGADADPLAASWRVGLGSVSALAMEPTEVGNSLARRTDFPALLAPLVRGSGLAETPERLAPTLTRDGADIVITSPSTQLTLTGPQGDRPLLAQPDGQGNYLARLYAPSPGGYSVDGAALGLTPGAGSTTGGQLLAAPGDVGRPKGWAWRGVWPAFALLALLAFLGGLALRYLPERPLPLQRTEAEQPRSPNQVG